MAMLGDCALPLLQVCRHHAAAVCDEAHGNATQFACPYHGWTYGMSTSLQ